MPLPDSYVDVAKLARSISLVGVKEKLHRAQVLREQVLDVVKQYDEAMKLNVEVTVTEQHWHVFRLKRSVPLPDGLAVIFGDYLNNARSALDYLAFQLVLVSGSTPSERTSFPIAKTEQRWKSMAGDSLKGVDRAFLPALIRSQPYRAVNPETHPLVRLNELNNENKHRLLPTTQVAYRELYYLLDLGQAHQFQYTSEIRPSPKAPMEAGDIVTAMRFTPTLPAGTKGIIGPGTLPTLGFDTPTMGRLGIKELPDFVSQVQRIVESVESLFDEAKSKLPVVPKLSGSTQGTVEEFRIWTHT